MFSLKMRNLNLKFFYIFLKSKLKPQAIFLSARLYPNKKYLAYDNTVEIRLITQHCMTIHLHTMLFVNYFIVN